MSSEPHPSWWIGPEEYLEAEKLAEKKHEYVGGLVYAMAGAGKLHNRIVANLVARLHPQLRNGPCEVFPSDMMVRAPFLGEDRFYYPDATVVCGLDSSDERIVDEPIVVFEVLSPSTAGADFRDKGPSYRLLPSLRACVFIDSRTMEVTVFFRPDTVWERTILHNSEDRIELPWIGCTLPLSDLYERTGLVPV